MPLIAETGGGENGRWGVEIKVRGVLRDVRGVFRDARGVATDAREGRTGVRAVLRGEFERAIGVGGSGELGGGVSGVQSLRAT
jgi:hypothetical protein